MISHSCSNRFLHWTTVLPATFGEFFSIRAVVQNIFLTIAAAFIILSSGGGALPINAASVIALVSGATSLLTSLLWFNGQRVLSLLRLPYTEKTIALSVCFTGVAYVTLSHTIPVLILVCLLQKPAAETIAILTIIGIIVSAISFLSITFTYRLASVITVLSTAAICSLPFFMSSSILLIALFAFLIASIAISGKVPEIGLSSSKMSFSFFSRNYFLSSAASEPIIWVDALGLLCLGVVLTAVIVSRGIFLPVNAIFAVAVTPLNTMLSRDRDTLVQMELMGNKKRIVRQYFFVLLLFPIAITTISNIVLSILGYGNPMFFVIGYVVSFVCAYVSIILEARHPLLNWEKESDVLNNPRRFIVILIATLVSSFFMIVIPWQ